MSVRSAVFKAPFGDLIGTRDALGVKPSGNQANHPGPRPNNALAAFFSSNGSKRSGLVEHIGFEPMISSMPSRRDSQLRQCPTLTD